jgi:pimeloyl-ACP methyl ester carboxylesterase
MSAPLPADAAHESITVGGVRLHYVEAGRGEPVVLLHGFPEFWYAWRHQLPALADAGFHAVAPDLRGYAGSDRPDGVRHYRVARLVEDLAGLIRSLGGRACVVGHDWGGVLAWRLAALHPGLVRKLAILNAPHPLAFRRELRRDWRQCLRSAYTLFFQLPRLPEWILRAGDFALMRRAWRRQPAPGAYTDADLAAYSHALGGPAGLTGPLNYYRAATRYPDDVYGQPQCVEVPTLLLWGERDVYLGMGLTEDLGAWVPDLRVERIPDASHWLQNDVPDRVNRSLIEFFGPSRGEPRMPVCG